jgi:peptidoglycan/LPS O-acetylase OafA/YrhL
MPELKPSPTGVITTHSVGQQTVLSRRIPAVDGFRAVAMLMVIACHVWEFSHRPTLRIAPLGWTMEVFGFFKHGAYGVDLFMVLSGFCLFLPLCYSEQALAKFHWKRFYRRRARRIIPPYYAGIAFATLTPFVLVAFFRLIHIQAHWQPLPGTAYAYFAHLFFLQTFSLKSFGQINASLWSMGLEAQFYLMFPLVVLGYQRFGRRFVLGMIAISIAYHILMEAYTAGMSDKQSNLYLIFFLGRWMQFAAGMLAAWVVAQHRRQDRWRDPQWGTLGILLAVALYTLAASVDFPRFLGWLNPTLLALAFALALVSVCVTQSPLGAPVSSRVMEGLGFISYSIFLVHWPIIYYFGSLLERLHLHGRPLFFALLFGGFATTLAIAFVFFRLFEKPFLSPPAADRKPAEAVA